MKKVIPLLLCAALLVGCGAPSSNEANKEANVESTSAVEEKTDEPTPEPTPEPTSVPQATEGDVGKYYVSIGEAEAGKTYDDKPCVIVSYTWTNNGDEAANFMFAISDKCFQDGIECESAIVTGEDIGTNSMKDIKPGATLEVKKAYVADPGKAFDIEISELISFSKEIPVAKSFEALN